MKRRPLDRKVKVSGNWKRRNPLTFNSKERINQKLSKDPRLPPNREFLLRTWGLSAKADLV